MGVDLPLAPSLPDTFELRDGRTVTVRVIRPGDAPLLVDMFGHLSERTRRLRYHSYRAELPIDQAITMSDLDPARQAALVALYPDQADEHIVGVARLARAAAGSVEAEVAVVVRDDFQGGGLGFHLLTLLLSVARQMGIQRLFGWVMAENVHMLQLFKRTDLPLRIESHSSELLVEVFLPPPLQ